MFADNGRAGGGHDHLFGRPHQAAAIALVAATFLLTSAFFSPAPPCPSPPTPALAALAGGISWPSRGYGTQLDLRIYVYEEEIDGFTALMRGRDGRISPESCVKGQRGTQDKIHWLLLKSLFRTMKKEEADLFFAPSYVKCVCMMGGLNDKGINQTYVKILHQMPLFLSFRRPWPCICLSQCCWCSLVSFLGCVLKSVHYSYT